MTTKKIGVPEEERCKICTGIKGDPDLCVCDNPVEDHNKLSSLERTELCSCNCDPNGPCAGVIGTQEEGRPKTVTQLINKNQAPMIIRKYQGFGWPLFVAVICDQDLSYLDTLVTNFVKSCDSNKAAMNNIQMFRDFCGTLSDRIVEHYNDMKYGSVEGVAVVSYWDKILCSSLYGDHMTHSQCRLELFMLLNMMTNM